MGREHAILSVFFWSGGIAQLVERQLCKLEVRGSNPLASKACKARRQHLQTGNTFGSLVRAQSGPLIRFAIPVLPAAEGREVCKIDRRSVQRSLRSCRCERRRLTPSAM